MKSSSPARISKDCASEELEDVNPFLVAAFSRDKKSAISIKDVLKSFHRREIHALARKAGSDRD